MVLLHINRVKHFYPPIYSPTVSKLDMVGKFADNRPGTINIYNWCSANTLRTFRQLHAANRPPCRLP
jgi:hypothetical protein